MLKKFERGVDFPLQERSRKKAVKAEQESERKKKAAVRTAGNYS